MLEALYVASGLVLLLTGTDNYTASVEYLLSLRLLSQLAKCYKATTPFSLSFLSILTNHKWRVLVYTAHMYIACMYIKIQLDVEIECPMYMHVCMGYPQTSQTYNERPHLLGVFFYE